MYIRIEELIHRNGTRGGDGRSPLILHKWQWKIESGYQIILENFCEKNPCAFYLTHFNGYFSPSSLQD